MSPKKLKYVACVILSPSQAIPVILPLPQIETYFPGVCKLFEWGGSLDWKHFRPALIGPNLARNNFPKTFDVLCPPPARDHKVNLWLGWPRVLVPRRWTCSRPGVVHPGHPLHVAERVGRRDDRVVYQAGASLSLGALSWWSGRWVWSPFLLVLPISHVYGPVVLAPAFPL